MSVSHFRGRLHRLFSSSILCFLIADMTFAAENYFVATNGNDAAAGTSWGAALKTVGAALALAVDDSIITVSNGVYDCMDLTMAKGVTLRSANGREATVLRNPPASNARVLIITHTQAVVQGFTIAGGFANNTHGGGIYMTAGTIKDCNICSNTASANGTGGGVFISGGEIHGCNIFNNIGSSSGGGAAVAGYCIISNCFIYANTSSHSGAGLRITANALITRCFIERNTNSYYTGGGGIYMTAGSVRNCLIAENRQTRDSGDAGGGGVRQTGGSLINCTIAANNVLAANLGGGVWSTGGSILNCVIYGNKKGELDDNLSASVSSAISCSCAPELTAGPGNTSFEPDFIDMAGGNYRLGPASPCIDTGQDALDLLIDLDGAPRPIDGNGDGHAYWDMGAYEAPSPFSGPLRCSLAAAPRDGLAPLEVVFQATVHGANTDGLIYCWDFDGDGAFDRIGAEFSTVTNIYGPGNFTVTLLVQNASSETAEVSKQNYINVQATELYVATGGQHIMPFATWATAATNLASAISIAGDGATITVSNGVYDCVDMILMKRTTLRSANGREATVLRNPPASNARVLIITHTQAVVQGFTIAGGFANNTHGGGIYMTAGTIKDCNICSNTASANGTGGGVFISGGEIHGCNIFNNIGSSSGGGAAVAGSCIISNCFIYANTSSHSGAGLRIAADALITRCFIERNTNSYYTGGGGIYMTAGSVRNCLIAENRQTRDSSDAGGGGVRQTGGSLINCTIAANNVLAANFGGGVWITGGSILNCVIHDNFKNAAADNLMMSGVFDISHTCAPELNNGISGNLTGNPLFEDPEASDFRLRINSPCINQGIYMPWMDGAIDLPGNKRVVGGIPDMGAYEYFQHMGSVLIVW